MICVFCVYHLCTEDIYLDLMFMVRLNLKKNVKFILLCKGELYYISRTYVKIKFE